MNDADRSVVKKWNIGSAIAFTVSLVVHLLATLILSWIIVAHSGSGFNGIAIRGSQLDDAMDSEMESLEISDSASKHAEEDNDPQKIPMPVALPLTSTRVDSFASISSVTPSLSSTAFTETGLAVMLGGGNEDSEGASGGSSKGLPRGTGASFFGARADGNRFVFVIDSSSSMSGRRWEALRIELNRALRSLSLDQEFFVISFDVGAHPMFNTLPPKGEFLKPTKENIDRLNRWIGSINHGSSTQPASAIGIALRLEPDAIFLLSDGEIRDATLYDLRIYNHSQGDDGKIKVSIPIHTVLLHSEVGYLTLKAIADENDGVFTPVTLFHSSR
ncbi:MAG: vWA domain-containing protein [Planctomycetota bacterium]|jgi:hypothetical protein